MFAPDPELDCDLRDARKSFMFFGVLNEGDRVDVDVSEVGRTDIFCVED